MLYGRFVFFHELAGRALYGDTWHARRLWCLSGSSSDYLVIDVGAGEGRLIEAADKRTVSIRGFDPSPQMRARSKARGSPVEPGSASCLPVDSGTVGRLVVTYPGGWIFDRQTWTEFDRVLAANGEVWILLGGSYDRGPLARLRSVLLRLAYGERPAAPVRLQAAEERNLLVRPVARLDRWGRGYYLIATRESG